MRLIQAVAVGCLLVAGTAHAQSAPADAGGGRYLSWANRGTGTTPADVSAAQARTQTRVANSLIPRRVAPSHALSQPMMQPVAQPRPVANGLTPASAWFGPRTVPAFAPGSPDPAGSVMANLPPPPRAASTIAVPAYAPAPTVAERPVAAPAPAPADDPMAPRRDAAIFRLQPQGAATTGGTLAASTPPASAQPGQQGARYYSVHRDAGRQPDPTPIPEPVFFDSVAIDLAEPPATEPLTRDAQGRRRVVANDDSNLP